MIIYWSWSSQWNSFKIRISLLCFFVKILERVKFTVRMKRVVFGTFIFFHSLKAELLIECPRSNPYAINLGQKCTNVFQLTRDVLSHPTMYRKGWYTENMQHKLLCCMIWLEYYFVDPCMSAQPKVVTSQDSILATIYHISIALLVQTILKPAALTILTGNRSTQKLWNKSRNGSGKSTMTVPQNIRKTLCIMSVE